MRPKACVTCSLPALALVSLVNAQPTVPPSSWPQVYPGMPSSDYSPEWQAYFQVTAPLPNVTWPLPRSWAGNILVDREGHANNSLFYWAIEKSNGSLTDCSDDPWAIWLNGGPGASSLFGFFFENGPIHIAGDYSLSENPYAWSNLTDMIWLDNPVGTGFSTTDSDGYVNDEEQMAKDFIGFLRNLVKVFPNLAARPLHIMGESYAGTYIPYIAKAYFEMEDPPVKLSKIAIGDGTMGATEVYTLATVVSVIETYPQLIGYDPHVFEYFREQSRLCGYDLELQYPQPAPFPTLKYIPGNMVAAAASLWKYRTEFTKREIMQEVQNRFDAKFAKRNGAFWKRERIQARETWKRNLADRANGTIDSWYGCDLYDEMVDYATNFTYPWNSNTSFLDVYDIPDALKPGANTDASVFLNDPRTRSALHAPTSKNWTLFMDNGYPFGSDYSNRDPSVAPMAFLSELATNATAQNVTIVIYSANDDSLVPHFGSQVTIQNTTFSGVRGFACKPETPWYNDDGDFAGIVHQERGWTYVLFDHAGHTVPYDNPVSALTFAREFIFGRNTTGLVTNDNCGSVVGGETSQLIGEILPGQRGIYMGSTATTSTYYYPTATVEAWSKYMATATPPPS